MQKGTKHNFIRDITLNTENGMPISRSINDLSCIKSLVTTDIRSIFLQDKDAESVNQQINIKLDQNNSLLEKKKNQKTELEKEIQELDEKLNQLSKKIQKITNNEKLLKEQKGFESSREQKRKELLKLEEEIGELEDAETNMQKQLIYISSKSSKEIRKALLSLPTNDAPKVRINIMGREYEFRKGKDISEEKPATIIKQSITNRINEYLRKLGINVPVENDSAENNKINLIYSFEQRLTKEILDNLLNPFSIGENKYDEETMKYYVESIVSCINDEKNTNIIEEFINMHNETIKELNNLQEILNRSSDSIPQVERGIDVTSSTNEQDTQHQNSSIQELKDQSLTYHLENLLNNQRDIGLLSKKYKESTETITNIINRIEKNKDNPEKTLEMGSTSNLKISTFITIFSRIFEYLKNEPLTERKKAAIEEILKKIRDAAESNIIGNDTEIDPTYYNDMKKRLDALKRQETDIHKQLERTKRKREDQEYYKKHGRGSGIELTKLLNQKTNIRKDIKDIQDIINDMDEKKKEISTRSKINYIKQIFEDVLGTKIPETIFRSIFSNPKNHKDDLTLLQNMTDLYIKHIRNIQKAIIKQDNESYISSILNTIINNLTNTINSHINQHYINATSYHTSIEKIIFQLHTNISSVDNLPCVQPKIKQAKEEIKELNTKFENEISILEQYYLLKESINESINIEDILSLDHISDEVIKLITFKTIFEHSSLPLEKKLLYCDIIEYNSETKKFTINCEDTNDKETLHNIFGQNNLEIINTNTLTQDTVEEENEDPTEEFFQILKEYYDINNEKKLKQQIKRFCKDPIYKSNLINLLKNSKEKFSTPDKVKNYRNARVITLDNGGTGRRLLFTKTNTKDKKYMLVGLYDNDTYEDKLKKYQ